MDVQRVSTGVSGLDSQLTGGFIRGRSYVVLGDAGTGKTTACLQFLLSGLKAGEKGLYITVDERPTEIIESAALLGCRRSFPISPLMPKKSMLRGWLSTPSHP